MFITTYCHVPKPQSYFLHWMLDYHERTELAASVKETSGLDLAFGNETLIKLNSPFTLNQK